MPWRATERGGRWSGLRETDSLSVSRSRPKEAGSSVSLFSDTSSDLRVRSCPIESGRYVSWLPLRSRFSREPRSPIEAFGSSLSWFERNNSSCRERREPMEEGTSVRRFPQSESERRV